MAKFIADDGSTFILSADSTEERKPKISPVLIAEMELIDTLKEISKNLMNETLNKDCILQLINGEQCECAFNHNCDRCICHWYITKNRRNIT